MWSGQQTNFGSGILPGEMLLVRIELKMIKLRLILDKVRLGKGKLCLAGLGKGFGKGPTGL